MHEIRTAATSVPVRMYVCQSISVRCARPAKTAEQIDVLFGMDSQSWEHCTMGPRPPRRGAVYSMQLLPSYFGRLFTVVIIAMVHALWRLQANCVGGAASYRSYRVM